VTVRRPRHVEARMIRLMTGGQQQVLRIVKRPRVNERPTVRY
jgi:hypothetical protein